MKWNGPERWRLPRFRRKPFWWPGRARYNCVGQWFRPLGDRRSMVFGRDHTPSESPVRTELVMRVRHEIALGVYETPEKLEIALQRLLEELQPREQE
jgi:hypothetical protein